MSALAALRTVNNHVSNFCEPLHQNLCEYTFAQRSHAAEQTYGRVLSPRRQLNTHYLPYLAAHPVAPHTSGLRCAGLISGAYWGASVGVSFIRNEVPMMTLFYLAFLRPNDEQGITTPLPAMATAIGLDAVAMGCLAGYLFETLVGTGHRCRRMQQPRPNHGAWAAVQKHREEGELGLLFHSLNGPMPAPTNLAGTLKQTALLGAATVVGCLVQGCRLVTALALGGVALLGAAVGVVYESMTYVLLVVAHRLYGGLVQSAAAAHTEETVLLRRAAMQDADDQRLPQPLIDALWNPRLAPAGGPVNVYVQGAEAIAAFMVMLHRPGLLRAERPRPGRVAVAPRRAQAHPFAHVEVPRAGNNDTVHGAGRDGATRRSVAALLALHPNVPVEATLNDLKAFITLGQRAQQPWAQRPYGDHTTRAQAALWVIDGHPGGEQFFRPITDARNVLNMDDQGLGNVAVSRIGATLWYAVGQLQAPDRDGLKTLNLRQERKEAFVAALSNCLEGNNLVCAPGIVQRLVLVLQALIPGVQVERYDAIAPVAQFVTAQAMHIAHVLAGRTDPIVVSGLFDAACQEGYAMYHGQDRETLVEQFKAMAALDYDLEDWQAPR